MKKKEIEFIEKRRKLRNLGKMGNDNYATDDKLMEVFGSWFDPCPLNDNPDFNGLEIDWEDQTYVNPPYSKPLPWVLKAIEENKKGYTIAMLLRMDTSTRWFKELQEAGAMFLWINGRLRFGTGKPAPFPSMLVILNKTSHNIGKEKSK